MKVLDRHPAVETTAWSSDAEALIREAKQRERRRRFTWFAAVVVLVAAGIGTGFAVSTTSRRAPLTTTSSSKSGTTKPGSITTPKDPYALAVAQDGALFVVDVGRDQILRRLPSGKFKAVAGNGKEGFSGDGGPAIDAKLRLNNQSGIAVGSDGVVYFSDGGNDRVRAVLTDGDIETVAGGGSRSLPTKPNEQVPALAAKIGQPAGLAISPDHQLYIAASFIVRLSAVGSLEWVAGSNSYSKCFPDSCSITEHHFDGVDSIALDGDGDLLATSSGFPAEGFGIAEVRADGKLVNLGALRGEGGEPAAIAAGPNGSVVAAAQIGLYRIADGSEAVKLIADGAAGGRSPSPLSDLFGWFRPYDNHRYRQSFYGGDGIAASANGDIFADASTFIGLNVNAIVELTPKGVAHLIWKSARQS